MASESGAWRGSGSVSRAGDDHGALRARGIPLAAKFAGNSNRELFRVPAADCPAHSIFPRGRKTFRRAALAAVHRPDISSGSREFLGRYPIFVDDRLARGGGVVFDRSALCGTGVCDSRCFVEADSAEADGREKRPA